MYIHKLLVPSCSSRLSDRSQAGLCLSWRDNPNCGWRQKDYTSNRCKDHSPLHPVESTKPSLGLVVTFKSSSAAISGVNVSQSWNMQQKSLNFELDQRNKEPQPGIGIDNSLIDWSHSRMHEVSWKTCQSYSTCVMPQYPGLHNSDLPFQVVASLTRITVPPKTKLLLDPNPNLYLYHHYACILIRKWTWTASVCKENNRFSKHTCLLLYLLLLLHLLLNVSLHNLPFGLFV